MPTATATATATLDRQRQCGDAAGKRAARPVFVCQVVGCGLVDWWRSVDWCTAGRGKLKWEFEFGGGSAQLPVLAVSSCVVQCLPASLARSLPALPCLSSPVLSLFLPPSPHPHPLHEGLFDFG